MTTTAPGSVMASDPHTAARDALVRARADHQGLVELLLGLEDHAGARHLDAVSASGTTRAVWASVQEYRAGAWADLEAHRRTLVAAEARHGDRPPRAVAVEVAALLGDPGRARDADDRPIGREDLVSRVRSATDTVRSFLDAVVGVQDALAPELAAASTALAAAEAGAAALGPASGTDPCRALPGRLEELRRSVREDPLAQLVGREVLRGPFATLRADAERLATWLEDLLAARDGAAERLDAVGRGLDALDAIDRRDAMLCAETALRVRGAPAAGKDSGAALRVDLARVRREADAADWRDVATHLPVLEQELARAAAAARARVEEHGAPLRERAALRARLDLYRTKAQHAGAGEDPELLAAHTAARDLLRSRPCDLDAARDAVAAHDAAVNARLTGGAR